MAAGFPYLRTVLLPTVRRQLGELVRVTVAAIELDLQQASLPRFDLSLSAPALAKAQLSTSATQLLEAREAATVSHLSAIAKKLDDMSEGLGKLDRISSRRSRHRHPVLHLTDDRSPDSVDVLDALPSTTH